MRNKNLLKINLLKKLAKILSPSFSMKHLLRGLYGVHILGKTALISAQPQPHAINDYVTHMLVGCVSTSHPRCFVAASSSLPVYFSMIAWIQVRICSPINIHSYPFKHMHICMSAHLHFKCGLRVLIS